MIFPLSNEFSVSIEVKLFSFFFHGLSWEASQDDFCSNTRWNRKRKRTWFTTRLWIFFALKVFMRSNYQVIACIIFCKKNYSVLDDKSSENSKALWSPLHPDPWKCFPENGRELTEFQDTLLVTLICKNILKLLSKIILVKNNT